MLMYVFIDILHLQHWIWYYNTNKEYNFYSHKRSQCYHWYLQYVMQICCHCCVQWWCLHGLWWLASFLELSAACSLRQTYGNFHKKWWQKLKFRLLTCLCWWPCALWVALLHFQCSWIWMWLSEVTCHVLFCLEFLPELHWSTCPKTVDCEICRSWIWMCLVPCPLFYCFVC
jgi:hypothetical protein